MLPKVYTVAIDQSANKALEQVDFNSLRSGNVSGSGGGSYYTSNVTCNKCGKKFHIHKDCRSKVNGSSRNPPKKSTNELPEWVTKNPVVLYTKDLETSTTTLNNKKYNWYTYFNNGNGAWVIHWKDGHEEWKNKQGQKWSVRFSNS